MKKLLVAVAAVLVSVATYAQGTVAFDNLSLPSAPAILDSDNTRGAGVNSGSMAALYLQGAGGTYTLVPNSATTFFCKFG